MLYQIKKWKNLGVDSKENSIRRLSPLFLSNQQAQVHTAWADG